MSLRPEIRTLYGSHQDPGEVGFAPNSPQAETGRSGARGTTTALMERRCHEKSRGRLSRSLRRSLRAACLPGFLPQPHRDSKSTNAGSERLAISSGILIPCFAAGTTTYNVTVGSAVNNITVTAAKAHSGARIEAADERRKLDGDLLGDSFALAEHERWVEHRGARVDGRGRNHRQDLHDQRAPGQRPAPPAP